MKTQLTNMVLALVATLTMAAAVNAQQTGGVQAYVQQPTQQTVMPPQNQNRFYFGMTVELTRGWAGTTLRIMSVAPGSPAFQAGLEAGDEIRTVNGKGFQYANDSYQAVSMMNQFTDFGTGPAPAVAASSSSAVAMTIMPSPMPMPLAQMVVRNVRNGQNVYVTVRPTRLGGGFPGPAPAAAAYSASQR